MKLYIDILLICITILPKINVINISSNSTGIRVEDILVAIYVLFSMINNFRKGKITFESSKMKKITKMFSIYFVACIISTIWGIYMNWITFLRGTLYLVRKLEYFSLLFIGYRYMYKYKLQKEKIIKMTNVLICMHFILVILQKYGVINSFNGGELTSGLTQGRISSTFNGAYEFSAFLLLILPLYLDSFFKSKKKTIKNIIFIIMIMFCIYLTKSRTSLMLSLLIGGMMFLKKSRVDKKKASMVLIGLCMVGIFALVNPVPSIDLSRFSTINLNGVVKVFKDTWKYKNFNKYITIGDWYGDVPYSIYQVESMGMDASLFMRVSHWMQMIDGLIKSPIVGLGVSISGSAADGNYVRILCESGILGLITWCLLLHSIYINLDKQNEIQNIVKYGFISLILGAVLIDLFEASKVMMMFWFILGISFADEELEKDDNAKNMMCMRKK